MRILNSRSSLAVYQVLSQLKLLSDTLLSYEIKTSLEILDHAIFLGLKRKQKQTLL